MTEPFGIDPRPVPPEAVAPAIGRSQPAPFRAVASWVTYDLANTIFSMGVISLLFPAFLKSLMEDGPAQVANGRITAVSMAVILVLSPLLGAMTDRARRRMPFLVTSTLLCVAFTMLFARAGLAVTVAAFVFANIAYQAGLQFYDSLIVEVTTEENRGRIGGIGVGVGYLGSFIAVGLALGLAGAEFSLLFTLVGVLFLAFAIPCFVFVRERGNPNPGRVFDLRVIAQSGRTTLKTLREGKQYPGLMRFLVGRVFYTDSINTVIAMMFLFATAIFGAAGQDGVTADQSAYRVMFVAIAFAVVGGFIWGRVVDRIGPKRTLDIVLYLWMATFSLASLVSLLGLSPSLLYVVGTMAGIGLGGIWSADRPLMLRLTPPDRIGEFYGLYGMVGRFSAIVGPAMWAEVIHLATGKMNQSILTAQGIAIALLLVMILVSWRILRPLDDSRRAWKPTR